MKLSRIFNSIPKKIAASAIIALAFAFPAVSIAEQTVTLEGAFGVLNQTTGQTQYESSTSASYDQVVKAEIYYHNTELPDSGKVAQNLRVKVNIPTAAGKTQTITETTSADNSNTITKSATVNLDGSDASLQYIPGTAYWKHDVGTNAAPKYVETKISDAVVTSGQGLVLENEQPCYNFAATVTVQMRVIVPGVKLTKQVELASQSGAWTSKNTANPNDLLKYLISYQNTGNTTENQVILRDNLPPKMTLVPGTTVLTDSAHPSGVKVSDDVVGGGINIGDALPGAVAYLVFEVKVPDATDLTCGLNEFNNVGVAHPQGMSEYASSAVTDVTKTCTPVTPPPTTSSYMCNSSDFNAEVTDLTNRTVKVTGFTTSQNNATFAYAIIYWGDGQTLQTNNVVGQTHKYGSDGQYNVSAVAYFTVPGSNVPVNNPNDSCAKSVNVTVPVTPAPGSPTTPVTTVAYTTPTTTLINTGPGQVIGLFAGVSLASAFAYRLYMSRKLAR